ncbi:MAG: DNA integrity scanning diadenylate cyclase DisA [Bacillota bacterium]|nr:DNA integrity scanning diadenylate cyclase DisA [Bacillota bacterium]
MSEGDKLLNALRILAPGTLLREGLDNVLRARTGALIVIGDSPQVMSIVDGGFALDCEFSPTALYELAKMDGALILSKDAKRILYANAELVPDIVIPSSETGMRHRTAERSAKQTGEIVVAISQRRSIITLYRGSLRYILRDFSELTAKANQAISTLEKYKSVLDRILSELSVQEFRDIVTVYDVVTAVHRAEMVRRGDNEVRRYLVELGIEGRLIAMQLEELTSNVEEGSNLLIRDYRQSGDHRTVQEIRAQLSTLSVDEMLDPINICRILGHGASLNALDQNIAPAGYRLLSKIQRLPESVICNLVASFTDFQGILTATVVDLDEVEGIGEVRARAIKNGLERLRDQVMSLRH